MTLFTVRRLFLISTALSFFFAVLIICVGIVEIIIDQDEIDAKRVEKQSFYMTHMFVTLLIMILSNLLIILHAIYITHHVLRGYRYTWYISWNYFHYLICEIISVCCGIGGYAYLAYPLLLHILTGILAVFLFFFNCWAMQIFAEREDVIKEQEEEKRKRRLPEFRTNNPCVRIPLRVSTGPGTSART